MPTYEYHCEHCEQTFDVFQSFQDDALTECPTCGNPVRKVYGNVGVVFKGSGFYKNDSRAKEPSKSGGDSSKDNGASPKESSDSSSTATATKAPASDGAKKESGSSDIGSKSSSTPKTPV